MHVMDYFIDFVYDCLWPITISSFPFGFYRSTVTVWKIVQEIIVSYVVTLIISRKIVSSLVGFVVFQIGVGKGLLRILMK